LGIAGEGQVLVMTVSDYSRKFSRLIVNIRDGRASPHKICMLLAMLDLARSGGVTNNRIYFAPPLLERYYRFFEAVQRPGDHPNPYFPFFHLAGKLRGGEPSFWHLEPLPGRETVLASLRTVGGASDITTNVAYASLDVELFELLNSSQAIEALGEAISKQWFDRGLSDLHAVVARSSEISRYEQHLLEGTVVEAREAAPPAYVRNPAFRRVVTQLYDYRCAATGVRLLLPTGEAMVEAAHIHPFAETGDDDPRNGLALTPNMHWAMDRNLIAPGPDLKWHVSSTLDARVLDYGMLLDLKDKPLFLPREARMSPKEDVLAWRMDRLRETAWTVDRERFGREQ
jgi:putative restriction endonuclease